MKELSSHILDLIANSTEAGASLVSLLIEESKTKDLFCITIEDNGCGMSKEKLLVATDCCSTRRKERHFGLGLALAKQSAERCEGGLTIESIENKGTKVKWSCRYSHIDRQPLGNMAQVVAIAVSNPDLRLIYKHSTDYGSFLFDSLEQMQKLNLVPPLTSSELMAIRREAEQNLAQIGAETY